MAKGYYWDENGLFVSEKDIAVADGSDETQGAKADAPATVADTTPFSVIAMLKGIYNKISSIFTKIDTSKVEVILHAHEEAHKGNHYVSGYLFTSVAKLATVYLRVSNGATKELHIEIEATVEGKVYGNLYEGTTYTDDGTVIDTHNSNRNSAKTSTATLYHTPTVDTLGNPIYPEILIPAGQKKGLVGGSRANGQETIIAPSTDGLIAVNNVADEVIDINITLEWYEESV